MYMTVDIDEKAGGALQRSFLCVPAFKWAEQDFDRLTLSQSFSEPSTWLS